MGAQLSANSVMAVAIQPTAGVFVDPGTTNLIACSAIDNGYDPITADDPTLTGALWTSAPAFLGQTGRGSMTIPLRGPGGTAPPAANSWGNGLILQAGGYVELRNATPITGTAQAGGTTSSIVLEASASSVDDFFLGCPIQHGGIGTGFRATSLIRDYVGAQRRAVLAETLGAAITGGTYTIPPFLAYVLGTAANVPLLSMSVWRGAKRYNYMDVALASLNRTVPVANQSNTTLPTLEVSWIANPAGKVDQAAPALPDALLTAIPPAKGGRFAVGGVRVGHQTYGFNLSYQTAFAPNQNFDTGQEEAQLTGGTRTVSLDLNQTAASALDLDPAVDAQTAVAVMSTWGLGAGNRFGALTPDMLLRPFSPADRNGFMSITGEASPQFANRSDALVLWW